MNEPFQLAAQLITPDVVSSILHLFEATKLMERYFEIKNFTIPYERGVYNKNIFKLYVTLIIKNSAELHVCNILMIYSIMLNFITNVKTNKQGIIFYK